MSFFTGMFKAGAGLTLIVSLENPEKYKNKKSTTSPTSCPSFLRALRVEKRPVD